MDIRLRDSFSALWKKYFEGADLPITLGFRDDTGDGEIVSNGTSLVFGKDSITCGG